MSRRAVSCESVVDASGPGEGSAGGAPSSMGAGVDEDGSSGSSSCAPRFLPLRPLAETWGGVRARARAQNAVQARPRTRSEPRNGALVSRTGQASGSELTMRRFAAPRWLGACGARTTKSRRGDLLLSRRLGLKVKRRWYFPG